MVILLFKNETLEKIINHFEYLKIADPVGCIFSDTLKVNSAFHKLNVVPDHTNFSGCTNGEILPTYQGGLAPYHVSWSPNTGQIFGNKIE
jgi:hypothetical protein